MIKIDSGSIKNINHVENRNSRTNRKTDIDNKKFDRIIIKADAKEKAEAKMTEQLQKTAKSNVIKGRASEEKLLMLKKQIEEGNYVVDPDELAKRILMTKGDN